jgi:hypothetical protein
VPDEAQTAAVRHEIDVELYQAEVEHIVPPKRILEETSGSPKLVPIITIRWSPVVTDAFGAACISFGEKKQPVDPGGVDKPAAHGKHVLFDSARATVEYVFGGHGIGTEVPTGQKKPLSHSKRFDIPALGHL